MSDLNAISKRIYEARYGIAEKQPAESAEQCAICAHGPGYHSGGRCRRFQCDCAAYVLSKTRGEGPCMDCGTLDNPIWFAPSELWNRVVGSPNGFLCPWCFIVRAERVVDVRGGWLIQPASYA